MIPFTVSDLPLSGLKLIERESYLDKRGFLARLFCSEELRKVGWLKPIAQINYSFTKKKGAVRGLHFQHAPYAEMKLVSCVRGEVWDVAVDIRSNSSTFLHWHAQRLSAKNGRAMMIPEGFAHGFQTLSEDCELIYFHTEAYQPNYESALNVEDPRLAISWPITIEEVSDKDRMHKFIAKDFQGMVI